MLLFCQVEEMDNSGHWLPNQDLLWQCGQIFLAEVAIDVAKHAVVGKFNEIRPGVYREFMKVRLCLPGQIIIVIRHRLLGLQGPARSVCEFHVLFVLSYVAPQTCTTGIIRAALLHSAHQVYLWSHKVCCHKDCSKPEAPAYLLTALATGTCLLLYCSHQ